MTRFRRAMQPVLLIAVLLGAVGCASSGPRNSVVFDKQLGNPAQLGLIAATGDPAVMPGSPGFSQGLIYFARVYTDQSVAIHTAFTAVTIAGANLSHCYLGVYDPVSRKQLAVTADISRQLATVGQVHVAFKESLAAQPVNKELWVALLVGGMTRTPRVIGDREYGTNLGQSNDYRLWVSVSKYRSLPATAPALKAPRHSSIPFLALGP